MSKSKIVRSFFSFLMEKKKYWLLPIVLMLIILGVLILLGEGTVVAPFIYSLF